MLCASCGFDAQSGFCFCSIFSLDHSDFKTDLVGCGSRQNASEDVGPICETVHLRLALNMFGSTSCSECSEAIGVRDITAEKPGKAPLTMLRRDDNVLWFK